ncbi:MAG: glycerophosphoryl diester phosphodiesterase [Paracoccaceae bacterium]|jgi:glycerophosphoryl diester phosphodiesterase
MTPGLTQALPAEFLSVPIAHRALHDVALNRPENSRAAISAAIAAGYGVEIDLQLSADGQAMVFHDYDMARLTGQSGPIRLRSAAQATAIALVSGNGETIPTLVEVLELIAGQVPLLIELKDQDGGMGPDIGVLEAATAAALQGYDGAVAVMSFNPFSVAKMVEIAPYIPCGLVTESYPPEGWPMSAATCARLREIPDFDSSGASFISHEAKDLGRPRVAELRASGVPVISWTIRSADQEAKARRFADNVTFEGYLAALPG